MLSATDAHGISVGSWKTKPMVPGPVAPLPVVLSAIRRAPLLGSARPEMMRSSVLLPQPEGPSRLTKAPRSMARSMPSSATTPLRKALPMPSRVTRGGKLVLHADLFIDELQRVALLPVHVGGVDALRRHLLEELAPALLAHRADAARLGVAAVDDAEFLHLVAPEGEEGVGLLLAVLLDQRVCRGRIAIEEVVPAFDRGIDEALHEIGIGGDQLGRGLDHRGVAGIAVVAEQHDDRFHALLLHREDLARHVTLLDRLLVGEEGGDAEGIGADLIVGVAVFRLEEEPRADPGVAADHDRLAFERGEAVIALAGMGEQRLRVLLEERRNRYHRHSLLDEIERDEGVRREVEIELPGSEQLRLVDLRSARLQRHREPVLFVDPP